MSQSKQVKRKLSESLQTEPTTSSEAPSPLSDSSVKPDDTDQDLVFAAEALTRLTNSVSPTPSFQDENSMSSRIASPLSSTSLQEMRRQIHPIVKRVNTISKLPLVTNAVRYYETSKRNYATFNYAAGIVEKAAMPVFNKIEVNLNSKHQARLEERARIKKKRRVNKGQEKHEIKKRIKFCLHILKLANENISSKVVDLQAKIKESDGNKIFVKKESPVPAYPAAINSQTPEFSSSEITPTSTNGPEKTFETNNEIVATVKKIVHVISNFRPSSLNLSDDLNGYPNDDVKLKKTIREIILSLPKQVTQNVPGAQKAPNQAISFARESLDMIGRLTNVFNEQLEKAENWVDGPTEECPVDPLDKNNVAPNGVSATHQPGLLRLKSEDSFHSLYSAKES